MEIEQAEITYEEMLRSAAIHQQGKDRFMKAFSQGVVAGARYMLEVLGYDDIPEEVLRRIEEDDPKAEPGAGSNSRLSKLKRRILMPGGRWSS